MNRRFPTQEVCAHERKPFSSRAQTFFITSANLYCRDKKQYA
ncbi:hypothetical protein GCWU000325_02418 [Alloprevotella tannerae ATCC 51259]|uniref:Uncharacterized protein n=1 Tax=Alloprevotella tannerae ATCC 51259 TaxID=626522 RepID=C9LJK5_9BACT|nr:hypothetical protein GCWU000325_02418 [Alloprevotella tannerae ATCC 51259]